MAPVKVRLCYPPDELVGEVAALSGRSTVFCPSPAVANEWWPTAAKGMVRRRWRRSLKLKFLFLAALLTYSMVQSPSWQANWFAASQEIPRISRNPKVHYRTHKRPPPVSILGQPNLVHIPTSYLLEIRPNIIHPSTPWSPQWPPSLRFRQQDPIHPPLLTHTRHMPSPSHFLDAWRRVNLYIVTTISEKFAAPSLRDVKEEQLVLGKRKLRSSELLCIE